LLPTGTDNICGIDHGKAEVEQFIANKLSKITPITLANIGIIKNGTTMIGFKTNGTPNNKGSFTWNNPGIKEAIPIAFKRLLLANKIIRIDTAIVAPVPPG
jgi:hypothetical protein